MPDIFIAAGGYDAPPYPGEPNVLLLSNGDGTYTDRSSTLPPVSDFTHSACVGDVNGDGYLDIYAGNVDNRIKPYFLLGNGDGTFTQTKRGLPTSVADHVDSYTSCLLADLDRDGHPELVLGYFSGNDGRPKESLILWNDGAGDFTKRPRYGLPPSPLGSNNFIALDIDVLDANRDGRLDLLVMSSSKVGATGFNLQMLINRGDGTFADETAARIGPSALRPSGPYCALIALADFNGDGFEDFYCDTLYDQSGGDETVPRYWLSNRIGGWTPIVPDSLPGGLSRIVFIKIVDFDGDGNQDLVNVGALGGDIWYSSFRNVTVRTVPSEPLIGKAVAGATEIAVSFAPPLSSGASPITGYTATCALTTIGSAVAAAGTASPITVAGLARGKNYACSVTAANALGTSLPSAAVDITTAPNYQGLWWNSPAGSESGWGINFAHQGDTIFATWFTYDPDGKPWWLGVTANQTAPGVFTGDLFTTTGPAFNAVPFNPTTVVETPVGSATFTFTGIDHGTFDYTVDGGTAAKSVVVQGKKITRQIFGAPPTCVWGEQPNLALATNYQDLWWKSPAGSESGWGINFTHQGDTIFATWFTYDANGKPWWLAMVAPRVGSTVYSGSLFTVTAPPFNAVPFDPANVAETTVGTGTVSFTHGNQATFSYTVNGVTQAKPITRQVFAGTGTVCR